MASAVTVIVMAVMAVIVVAIMVAIVAVVPSMVTTTVSASELLGGFWKAEECRC